MIVVDTNVIAYLLIAGEKTELAQQAYDKDHVWIVPLLWQHEFLNVLASFVQYGGGSIEDATEIWQQATALFITREHELDMEQALYLAHEHGVSAYDAQFASTALELELPLISEDRRLLHAFPTLARSLHAFIDSDLDDAG